MRLVVLAVVVDRIVGFGQGRAGLLICGEARSCEASLGFGRVVLGRWSWVVMLNGVDGSGRMGPMGWVRAAVEASPPGPKMDAGAQAGGLGWAGAYGVYRGVGGGGSGVRKRGGGGRGGWGQGERCGG